MADEEYDELYYARKLGLTGKDSAGRKKLEAEYARDGFGDDFLGLFDFLDEAREGSVDDEADSEHPVTESAPIDSGKYVPPHLRVNLEGAVGSRKSDELSIMGLLNRVSEGNLDSISSDILGQVSRSKIHPADIAYLLVGMSCDNPHITLTLQATFAAIACALAVDTAPSNSYSGAILASIVDKIKTSSGPRVVSNAVRLISILFSFGLFGVEVVEATLYYVAPRNLEWLLVSLRFAGKVLKDNHRVRFGALLSNLVQTVENTHKQKDKQTEFAVKELLSMTDSKCGFRATDHLQTACDWLHKGGSVSAGWKVPKVVEAVQLLQVPFDLFGSCEFPQEWINRTIQFDPNAVSATSEAAVSLEELAAMSRMNTEVKKNAFIALMGSVDPKHALIRFEQFGLLDKPQNVSSIVGVVVHCALQEATHNPFYTQVIKNLCKGRMARKFSVSFKIELSSLVSKVKSEQVHVLSAIISAYIDCCDGTVSLDDIMHQKKRKLDSSNDS